MASRAQTAQADDNQFDDLFDYDVDTGIPDLDVTLDAPGRKNTSTKKVDLGVDEEVKITRVKRPTVKLDADRLLSPQGLPKLRRTAPEQLGKKLKGKGHEYRDAARILAFYQLWADDLYRKATFRDTISIIEKLGHTKRVQIARNQYLDDYLPKSIPPETEAEITRQENGKEGAQDTDDDLYEVPPPWKPRPRNTVRDGNGGSLFLGGNDSDDDPPLGEPDNSELDASVRQTTGVVRVPDAGQVHEEENPQSVEDEFDDGFEVIDDWDEIMDGVGPSTQAVCQSSKADTAAGDRASIFGGGGEKLSAAPVDEDELDDEDALEAMYGF
ncbi:Swi3-domain-containing protein [Terfezia boudieri ATCC MYA-4762]|uniref:Chromosome segregation in meiosis protein n=1 Tax=Terfezia boudieri ATCC MYA-4762 TaxID=1051890 RepID=A0A3N4LKN0_9PEZI|nr:Swi3-domain-containing protein [Terfezia boudieri ATCC MYA-4762]